MDTIKQAIIGIMNAVQQDEKHPPIGCLSAGPRKLCYEIEKQLGQHPENREGLRHIRESLFMVSLDQEEPGDSLKLGFTNYPNRWFGTMGLVVLKNGDAGIIGPYTRGDDFSVIAELLGVVTEDALSQPAPEEGVSYVGDEVGFRKIPFRVTGEDLAPLEEVCPDYFYSGQSIFRFNQGTQFFIDRELNPNAAVQLAFMLATQEVEAQQRFPIMAQAVSIQGSGSTGSVLDWVFVPATEIKAFYEAYKANRPDEELYELYKRAVDIHAERVKATDQGWSPTFFLQQPEGEGYDSFANFCLDVGRNCEGAYGWYLFRMLRLLGSVDILNSFHRLPPRIQFLGRPGGTLEAVSSWGAHIAHTRKGIEISFMPNSFSGLDLSVLSEKIQEWLELIGRISPAPASADEEQSGPMPTPGRV